MNVSSLKLLALINKTNSNRHAYEFIDNNTSLSDGVFYFCLNNLFTGYNTPCHDVKVLSNGFVSFLDDGFISNGKISFYALALLMRRKKTIVFNHMEKRVKFFNDIFNSLVEESKVLTHYNVYWSPPESIGAGMHSDNHDVIVIQLSGKKRWRFETEDIILSPGDILYVSKGTQHNPVTEGTSHSLHLTIGVVTGLDSFPYIKVSDTLSDCTFDNDSSLFVKNIEALYCRGRMTLSFSNEIFFNKSPLELQIICGDKHFSMSEALIDYYFDGYDNGLFYLKKCLDKDHVFDLILSLLKLNVMFTLMVSE